MMPLTVKPSGKVDPVQQYKGQGPWTVADRRDAVKRQWPLLSLAIDDRHLKESVGDQKLLIHARGPMDPGLGKIVRKLLTAFATDPEKTTKLVLDALDVVIGSRHKRKQKKG